jgi:DNA-binding PadR family transcriptional regulator
MDQLFERLLPSALEDEIEAARWPILNRIRVDIASGIQPVGKAAVATPALNYGDYHILLVLERGERHGYAISTEVEQVTEGATKFGPGTLYTSIQRLLKAGLIQEARTRPDPRVNDEPRRYFRLTGVGQRVLAEVSEKRAARLRHAQVPQIVRVS